MFIGEYEMESPLMNAGGVVKSLEDVRMMAETGVGAIIAGSYTLEPRVGNSPNGETVYYHDSETGITYNSLGMPNQGIREVAQELPEMIRIAHDFGKPLVLNIAPVSDDPSTEIIEMFGILSMAGIEKLDGVELNAGCPNVVTEDGGRHELLSHHSDMLGDTLHELHDIMEFDLHVGNLMVRISPFRNRTDALNLVELLASVNVNTVSAFNTFPGGVPLDASGKQILQVPNGIGGQSGPGKAELAEEQTQWLLDAQADEPYADFEIVGSNGVIDAGGMKRRLDLGAKAVSVTTLFYQSPSWKVAVNKLLDDYASLV